MKKIKEFFNEEGKFNVKDVLVLTIIVVLMTFSNLLKIIIKIIRPPETAKRKRLLF